jgi:hypothetical protein
LKIGARQTTSDRSSTGFLNLENPAKLFSAPRTTLLSLALPFPARTAASHPSHATLLRGGFFGPPTYLSPHKTNRTPPSPLSPLSGWQVRSPRLLRNPGAFSFSTIQFCASASSTAPEPARRDQERITSELAHFTPPVSGGTFWGTNASSGHPSRERQPWDKSESRSDGILLYL